MSEIADQVYALSVEDESLFQEIRAATWDLVKDRVANDPDSIENVQLFRLFSEMNKVQLTLQKSERPQAPEKVENLTQILMVLPPERQKELLPRAIRILEERGEDASVQRQVLRELTGGTNGSEEAQ